VKEKEQEGKRERASNLPTKNESVKVADLGTDPVKEKEQEGKREREKPEK
jgi:hypothetical protein